MAIKKIIYGYEDPRTDFLRYVGRSSSGMRRPTQFQSHPFRCGAWIKSLAAIGLKPRIVVLEQLLDSATNDEINAAEIRCIAYARTCIDAALTNLTDGGGGIAGYKDSEETRAKKIAKLTGRIHSPESKAKQSAAMKGRKLTPEHRAKLSAAAKGKKHARGYKHSPETKAKLAAAMKIRWASPESRANHSRSMKLAGTGHKPGWKMPADQRARHAPFKGRKHTPETIRKMSISKRRREGHLVSMRINLHG